MPLNGVRDLQGQGVDQKNPRIHSKRSTRQKQVYSNMENLVLRARSDTEGSASEFCDKIPSGDNQSRVLRARIFTQINYMAANPYAISFMWEWYVSHVTALEQFHPVHYERVIEAIVPVGGIGKEEQVKIFFKDYMRQKDKAKDVIKFSLEKLEINSRMRV